MIITRVYSDQQGDTHFEDIGIELVDQGDIGFLSENFPVKGMQLRRVAADYDFDFHCAPQKQYIVLLDGAIEIQTSLGQTRQFPSGSVLLVEDTWGKGHKTKNLLNKERLSLFIHV